VPTHVWVLPQLVVTQPPEALHVFWVVVLAHSTWLGAQTPVHKAAPLPPTTQVWLLHVCVTPNTPALLHV
jgi:hypothetical protein